MICLLGKLNGGVEEPSLARVKVNSEGENYQNVMKLSKTLSLCSYIFCSKCFYRSDVGHLCFVCQTGYSCTQFVVSALNVSQSIRSYFGVLT